MQGYVINDLGKKNETPHIIMISETKLLSSDLSPDYFRLPNYDVFRNDRMSKNRGGVAILVQKPLSAELILDVYHGTESIACKIKYGKRDLLVACMYRPPDSPQDYNLNIISALKELSEIESDQVLICGDFNFPKIDWVNHLVDAGSLDSSDSVEIMFYDVCQDAFLHQHVMEFTRVRGDDEPSLLDLVLTRNELEIDEIRHDDPIGKSDHVVLVFDFTLEGFCEVEEFEFSKKNFFKGDYIAINNVLSEMDLSLSNLKDVHEKWNFFYDIFNEVSEQYIPNRLFRGANSQNQKWMTSQTARLNNEKAAKWIEYRNDKSPEKYREYTRVRNDSVKMNRLAKMEFEMKIADDVEKGDFQAFYAYMRSQTSIKEGVNKVVKSDGSLSRNSKETADTFNQRFQSVFIREDDGPLPHLDYEFNGIPLDDITFNETEVKEILLHIKENSSPGPDGIHPNILKECADHLSHPLYCLFRDSLNTGIIPDIWKTANVTPIYKKGSKSDSLNYRPVSLTSVVCKVLERIIRNRIMEHLDRNNLLSPQQHGFRSKRSCLTQLLEYFQEVHDYLDEIETCGVDAIYLDCKKAFDTVPHKRLLIKLRAYGITGNLLKWIESFLTNRTQRVVINGVHSDSLPVLSGVPQGSVIGPRLFLIYINDLLDSLTSKGKLFADDSKVFRKIIDERDRVI